MNLIHLFQANFRKQIIEMKRYAPNTVALFLTVYIILSVCFLIQLIGNPDTQSTTIQYTIAIISFGI